MRRDVLSLSRFAATAICPRHLSNNPTFGLGSYTMQEIVHGRQRKAHTCARCVCRVQIIPPQLVGPMIHKRFYPCEGLRWPAYGKRELRCTPHMYRIVRVSKPKVRARAKR